MTLSPYMLNISHTIHYIHGCGYITISGANADEKDKDGRTALFYASINGRKETVQVLIGSYGMCIVHNFIIIALGIIIYTYVNKIAHTVQRISLPIVLGANVHERCNNGGTALHYAACNGHTETVQLLIDT